MSLDNEPNYEVVSIETSGEIDRSRLNLTLNNLASYIRSPSITSMDTLTPRDDYNSGFFFIFYFSYELNN